MKLTEANRRLKIIEAENKPREESIEILSKVLNKNTEGVRKLFNKTGLKSKLNSLSEESKRVTATSSKSGDILISIDGGNNEVMIIEDLDVLMKSVLGLKKRGFFYLYKLLLCEPEIISLLLISNHLKQYAPKKLEKK